MFLNCRETLEAYSSELKILAMKMLDLMAKALGMDPNDMRILFEGHQGMRMNYYPLCPQPECAIGLNYHSNADGLTILLQINEMEGLQIRKDDTSHGFLLNPFQMRLSSTLETLWR